MLLGKLILLYTGMRPYYLWDFQKYFFKLFIKNTSYKRNIILIKQKLKMIVKYRGKISENIIEILKLSCLQHGSLGFTMVIKSETFHSL